MRVRVNTVGTILIFDRTESEINRLGLDEECHLAFALEKGADLYSIKKNIKNFIDGINNIEDFPTKCKNVTDGNGIYEIIKEILYETVTSKTIDKVINYLQYHESEDILEKFVHELSYYRKKFLNRTLGNVSRISRYDMIQKK